MTGEHFQERSRGALLDEIVLFIRLARVLSFARFNHVHLASRRRKRPHGTSNTEKNELGDVSEVESHTPAVRTAVFAPLGPDDVGDITEPPGLHDLQPLGQKGVGNPKIQVRII